MSTVGSVLISFGAATAGYFAGSKSVKDDAGSIGSTFGGIGGAITGTFVAVGAGLVAGLIGGIAALKSAGEEIVNLAHDAEKLSVSTRELSQLRFAAKQTGVDAETLSHAMLKLQETVGKAATEGGEAAAKIQGLGLDLKTLENQNPADQFKTIASAIAAIQNPSQRAAAEVALFGKSGAELKPLLEQGASGLNAMAAEADKLGITLNDVDAQNTLRAGQAVQKVQDAVGGLTQHIAAGLAPIVENVANRIVAWAEEGNRMQSILNGALEGVAYGAAFVASCFKLGQASIEVLGGTGEAVLAGLVAAFDLLYKAGTFVLNKVFGTTFDTTKFDSAVQHLADKSKELFASAGQDSAQALSGETAQKVFAYFDQVKATANATSETAIKAKEAMNTAFTPPAEATENAKKIAAAIADLHKQVDEFGLSEGAKKLAELKLLGATDAQTAEATALADKLDMMKKQADVAKELLELAKQARQAGMDEGAKKVDDLQQKGATTAQIEEAKKYQAQIEAVTAAKAEAKKLDEEAKKAKEDALTPLQKEQDELRKLQTLYESGRITAQEYASAAAKKEGELHGEEHKTQESVSRGSQESFKLMNEINNRSKGGDKKEKLAEQQLNAQNKTNQYILDLTKRLAPKPTTPIRLGA